MEDSSEPSHHRLSNDSFTRSQKTPETSPERHSEKELQVTRLPYRLKSSVRSESTPESSPERDGFCGVRLPISLVRGSLDVGEVSALDSRQMSTDREPRDDGSGDESGSSSWQMENGNADAQAVNGYSRAETDKHKGDRQESSSPDRSPGRQSLINGVHLRPLRLPQRFFPDASTSVSFLNHGQERPRLDGAVLESPTPPNSVATGEEYVRSSAVHGETERNERQAEVPPPAYQPRPLNVRRRQRDRLLGLIPSRSTRRKVYQWVRLIFLDLLFLFIFLVVTGIVLLWGRLWHWEDRLFPMTFDPYSNTWYGPVEFSYPRHDFILSVTMIGIMIPLIPLLVIILTQYWIRSWLDFHAAFWALKKAMVLMYVISASTISELVKRV